MVDQLSSDLQSLRIARDPGGGGFVRGSGGGPSRRGWVWIPVLVILVAAGVGARPYYPALIARLAQKNATVETTEVALVSPAGASVQLTASGYVAAQRTGKVGSRLGGRIAAVRVKEWDSVKAGQILFIMDSADQRSSVAAARARALAGQARIDVASATLAEMTQQVEREKRLAASGSVPQSAVDDLVARQKEAAQQVRAAEADAHALHAEANTLDVRLSDLTVTSPIDGVATTKPVAVGDVVTPSDTLVTVVDLSSVDVEVDVAENRLSLVKVGAPCEIVLDAYPDKRYRGEVAELAPFLDKAKASIKVKVKFSDPVGADVKDQMSARVSFLTKPLDASSLNQPPKKMIASSAVADRGGQKVAFKIENGRAHLVPLKLGPLEGGRYEVLEGPAPGERLVNNPAGDLKDNDTVRENADK